MKIAKYTLVLAAGLALASCTENFGPTNDNPNKITVNSGKLAATAMFEPILYGGANYLTLLSYQLNDELVQHTAFTGATTNTIHRYNISDNNWSSYWNSLCRYASDCHEMNRLAKVQNDPACQAVSTTMYVLFMQNVTDLYGDIPYKEAFQSSEGNMKPVFDSQEEVYTEMCRDLENANKLYATNPFVGSNYGALDAMYKFDMNSWRKFNNSLYLRVLGRLMGRTSTIVDSTANLNVAQKMQQIIDNPQTYPIFTSNDDNATVHYSAVAPYYSQFDPASYTENNFTRSSYHLTEQMIKMMVVKGNDIKADLYIDPRLPIIGQLRNNTAYWKGTVSGGISENQNSDDANSAYLNSEVLRRNNADEFLINYDELQFILAEAAERGVISGGEEAARTYYEQGVTANVKKWTEYAMAAVQNDTTNADYWVNDEEIQEFLNSQLASWDLNTDHLALILNQKYLATFWVGLESYNDYRRTGYPTLTIGRGTDFNDFILPTRMGYPNNTVATNSVNAEAALKRMGGENDMKLPVWWSKQAIEQGK